jgi:cobalt/nickel transport system permease protein
MNIALRYNAIPDSPPARWDPRWKLAAFFVAVVAVALLNHVGPSAVALAAGVVLLVLSKLRWRWLRVRLAAFALAGLPFLLILPFTLESEQIVGSIGPLPILERGLMAGLAVFCRCLAIGCFVLVLIGTAPLHVTFTAAHSLRIPGVFVLLAQLAWRYAFLLFDELRRLRVALWVRGFRTAATRHGYRTLGHAIGAGLVRGADRAEHVAEAMRCRGFDGRFHTLAEFRSRFADVVSFLLVLVFSVALVVWDRL